MTQDKPQTDSPATPQSPDAEAPQAGGSPRIEDPAPTAAIFSQASAEKTTPQGIGLSGQQGTAPIRTASPDEALPDEAPSDKAPDAPAGRAADAVAAAAGAPAAQGALADTARKAASSGGAATPPRPATSATPAATPPPPGMAESAFRAMSYLALLFLVIILGMQTAAGLLFPSIYLPAEAAVAEVYEKMQLAGQWIVPPVTDALPAALPGYFWFMRAVDSIPGVHSALFLPLAAALSALVTLLGVYVLGLGTGLGNRVAFAAGLILLSCLSFVPLTHWVGPDMLAAGLLCLSLACLYRGWVQERAYACLCAGFVLAGLAALAGGVVALWIPLVSSLALLIWRGVPRRGHGLDAVIGFGLMLLCVAGWLGGVILFSGESATALKPLFEQLLSPLMPPLWPPRDAWWSALALLPLAMLPWALVPLFVPWNTVMGKAMASLKASRKENSGTAWLWIALVAGLALCTISSHKSLMMVVPLLPLAALLLAKALMNLPRRRSQAFYLLLAGLCLLAGAVLLTLSIPAAAKLLQGRLPAALPLLDAVLTARGLPVLGAVCLVAGLVLYRLTNRAYPGGALAVFVLLAAMLVQPATLLTGPSLVGVAGVELPRGMGIVPQLGKEPTPAPVQIPGLMPEPKQEQIPAQTLKQPQADEQPASEASPAPQAIPAPPAVPADAEAPRPESSAQEPTAAPELPEAAPAAPAAQPEAPAPAPLPHEAGDATQETPVRAAPEQPAPAQ